MHKDSLKNILMDKTTTFLKLLSCFSDTFLLTICTLAIFPYEFYNYLFLENNHADNFVKIILNV